MPTSTHLSEGGRVVRLQVSVQVDGDEVDALWRELLPDLPAHTPQNEGLAAAALAHEQGCVVLPASDGLHQQGFQLLCGLLLALSRCVRACVLCDVSECVSECVNVYVL